MGKKDKKGYKRIHHGNPVICSVMTANNMATSFAHAFYTAV